MAVEFRLLGAIEACAGERSIDVGYAQQQRVLAVLLVEANRAVTVDQLVDRVWGARRIPRNPRASVQHSMTLLRKVLTFLPGAVLERAPAGYRLAVDQRAVDLHRFRELTGRERFAEALELWRGEPFTGIDTPWFNSLRETLTRQYQAARLDLIDIRLRRGEHTSLLAELSELAALDPWDERIASQYLLALYRSGRQAQALEHFDLVRRKLADHLGADPSPALRELHQRILSADTALELPGARTQTVPRQLPMAPKRFTGRIRELASLDAADGPTVISAIGGTGGIGKTWLALHWAYRHLDRFPDGQLHVNLRGFDQTGQPLQPSTALRGFLAALGVESIPVDTEAQAAMYRSLVADKRMLIVLDNARDAAQVEPLLPGGSRCTVLITTRNQLASLVVTHGAQRVDLGTLSEQEAAQLLAEHIGASRMAAEPEATAEILARCAGLPLAISIVAARAGNHPDFPLSVFAEQLRDELDAFDSSDHAINLRAVLSWSYRALPSPVTRVVELIGLAPGPDISTPAVASLVALPIPRTLQALHTLEQSYLVQQHSPGRYRMHDLVRLYAADRAQREQPDRARSAALRRLVDFGLHTALAAAHELDPNRQKIETSDPLPGCHPQSFRNDTDALAWLHLEHPNLLAYQELAIQRDWHEAVWQLAWALDNFHWRQGRLPDCRAMWQASLASANDPVARMLVHLRLGNACAPLGALTEAQHHLHEAAAAAEQIGDVAYQAHTEHSLAWLSEEQGDDEQALRHASTALSLFQRLDKPTWEANALNSVGWYSARLGKYPEARVACESALGFFQEHTDGQGEGATLDTLGFVAYRTGDYQGAMHYYQCALSVFRELGYAYEEANTLVHIGETYKALALPDRAREAWQQAHALFKAQNRPADAASVLDLL